VGDTRESPRSAASRWFADEEVRLEPLGSGSSFSDVTLWRVQTREGCFVLRKWGPQWSSRVYAIHAYQLFLNAFRDGAGIATPEPLKTIDGNQRVHWEGQRANSWTLVRWVPGEADYWRSPTPKKLEAALSALGRLHRASLAVPIFDGELDSGVGVSPALLKRHARLVLLMDSELLDLRRRLHNGGDEPEHSLSLEAVSLIERAASRQLQAVMRVAGVELPLQWRHGDPWHDHILFTGDEVSGIIDFGAAGIDSPAGDVARLLGSLVGDDREGWRRGLDAYQSVRPLSDRELEATHIFDATGTIISAANWIGWLRDVSGLNRPVIKDRIAAVERLRRLVERLRVLATGTSE
jgi:Ser/Thr protein kinase RdoA (MazF antagonist)